MGTSKLLRKILNLKEHYIETISGSNIPEEDKTNLDNFLNQIKLNKGKLISIGFANCSDLKSEYVERFVGRRELGVYSSGYIDDYEYHEDFSHHFIVHYKCYKKLEYQEEPLPLEIN